MLIADAKLLAFTEKRQTQGNHGHFCRKRDSLSIVLAMLVKTGLVENARAGGWLLRGASYSRAYAATTSYSLFEKSWERSWCWRLTSLYSFMVPVRTRAVVLSNSDRPRARGNA